MKYTMAMDALERVAACTGFDWDAGNILKNWTKHGVSVAECEQVFFNRPLVAALDERHSASEPRYFVLGHADSGRELFVVVTVRGASIRVISARNMNQSERRSYRAHGKKEEADS
jgi:uncharacterized DUF497 family protein